jgi:hypothetical protein
MESTQVTPEAKARVEQLKRAVVDHRRDGHNADDRLAQAKLNVRGKLVHLGITGPDLDAILGQLDQATLAAYDAGRHLAYRCTARGELRDAFGVEVDA